LRFEKSTGSFITTDRLFANKIVVNANDKYQTMMGWGGAFTDSTGINIDSLDEQAQDKLLESYFSDHGIEYNLCRVPIGSTDFSERAYLLRRRSRGSEIDTLQIGCGRFSV
jgi:glucosylceramidase